MNSNLSFPVNMSEYQSFHAHSCSFTIDLGEKWAKIDNLSEIFKKYTP